MSAKEPKFIVDFMLGRLCKWLRLLGYDAVYFNQSDHTMLVYNSLKDMRIILTRNNKLSDKRGYKIILINSDKVDEQIKQVIEECRLKIDKDKMFTRCSLCNTLLKEVSKEQVKGAVPEYVWETQEKFYFCENCNKIYWPGTHIALMEEKIKNIVNLA
jgi:uncharacterized protein with PIN domain